jgi:hypothetical protein
MGIKLGIYISINQQQTMLDYLDIQIGMRDLKI